MDEEEGEGEEEDNEEKTNQDEYVLILISCHLWNQIFSLSGLELPGLAYLSK